MNGKTTIGYTVDVNGEPVFWKSRLSRRVASGTPTACYIAMDTACREAIFIMNLLDFAGFVQKAPMLLEGDNSSAIRAIDNTNPTPLTKVLPPSMFYVRDCKEDGLIKPVWIPSAENIADIFTKPLEKVLFSKFCALLLSKS